MNREQTLELLRKYGRIASQDMFQPTLDELKQLWSSVGATVEQGWQPSIYFVVMKGKEFCGSKSQLWNRYYDRQHILLPL